MVGRKIDIVVDYGVPTPEYAHDGDAGLDLRIREAATLEPGERHVMGTVAGWRATASQSYRGVTTMPYDERPSRQESADSCLGCLTAVSFVLAACGRL